MDKPKSKIAVSSRNLYGPKQGNPFLSPTPNANRHILTMQVNFSEYCIAVSKPNLKTTTIAHAVTTNLFTQYRTPRAIPTDRGGSKLMRKLERLSPSMFAHNTSRQEATNFTPYELVSGRIARTSSSFPQGVDEKCMELTYGT